MCVVTYTRVKRVKIIKMVSYWHNSLIARVAARRSVASIACYFTRVTL